MKAAASAAESALGGAVGGREPGLVSGPEPAVDVLGEEVRTVTAAKVAQATGGPEVLDV